LRRPGEVKEHLPLGRGMLLLMLMLTSLGLL
jgi:hypothetical protein